MSFRIHQGDALTVLRTLSDESVHCVITSPPYWGLRDYGTASWEGGDPRCDHLMSTGTQGPTNHRANRTHTQRVPYKEECGRCGAVRLDQQLGLEATPELYVAAMVEVFREVRRVLRADGTLWLNMGDCYSGGRRGKDSNSTLEGSRQNQAESRRALGSRKTGLAEKQLVGMPWRLALALQADGWWLRQDIIWHKPAPMPESVRDRCTKAHEYVFLLSRSKRYHYDQDSIKEPASPNSYDRGKGVHPKAANVPAGWDTQPGNHRQLKGRYPRTKQNASFSLAVRHPVKRRNKRDVWTLDPMPTPEAHFATFPIELPELCLKAGCPEGGLVLDPFAGAGTTGLACLKNNRRFLGIELNADYIKIALQRARKYYPLLMEAIA